MKKLKVVLSVLLAVAMMLFVCVTAHAVGAPYNLNWSGTVACWAGPSGDIGNGYVVCLYKNGSQVSYFTTYSSSADMIGGMQMNGAGDYTFSVYIDYGDVTSETKYSGVYTYAPSHTHTMKHIDFQYADCTSDGVKEHYECTGCGKWFWDANGEYEITDHSDVVLPAYGHNWGEWKVVKQPTKTEPGTEMRVCNEDPDHAEYREIPPLGDSSKPTQKPTQKATQNVTEVSTDAPSEKASDKPSEKSSEKATENASETTVGASQSPTGPTAVSSSNTSGSVFPWLLIGAVVLILLGAAIIVLVIVLRKRNDNNQPLPPAGQPYPQTPYADPTTQAPDNNSFNDHYDNM